MLRQSYPTALRVIGVIVIGFAVLAVICGLFAPEDSMWGVRFTSLQEVARFAVNVSVVGAVGVGLLLLQRWAAAILSVAGIYWAFVCVSDAVKGLTHTVPDQWDWVGFIFAPLLVVPAVLTVFSWKCLSWWRSHNNVSQE